MPPKRLYNFTPHAINFVLDAVKTVSIQSDGDLRCTSRPQNKLEPVPLGGASDVSVPVTTPQWFNGLDPATLDLDGASGVIVSAVVAEYITNAGIDFGVPVYSPGVLVRNTAGAIVGTRGLVLYPSTLVMH